MKVVHLELVQIPNVLELKPVAELSTSQLVCSDKDLCKRPFDLLKTGTDKCPVVSARDEIANPASAILDSKSHAEDLFDEIPTKYTSKTHSN